MITQKQQRGFILAMKAGEIMLESGGELYRSEEIIKRICHACDIQHVEVFATATGIFASIGSGGESGDTRSYVKSIPNRSTNLQKISEVNNLSRKFVNGEIDIEDAFNILKEIEKGRSYHIALQLIGAGAVASLFCYMFGGTLNDSFIGIFVGIITYIFSIFLGKLRVGYFITDFCCCAFASFVALLLSSLDIADAYDHIIIGTLMLFVPGAATTNALRDILNGDMLSGIARITEAVAIAVALASGAGVMIKIWTYIGGVFI